MTNPAYPTPFQLFRTTMQEFEYPKFGRSYKATLDRLKQFVYQQAITDEKTLVLIVDSGMPECWWTKLPRGGGTTSNLKSYCT